MNPVSLTGWNAANIDSIVMWVVDLKGLSLVGCRTFHRHRSVRMTVVLVEFFEGDVSLRYMYMY